MKTRFLETSAIVALLVAMPSLAHAQPAFDAIGGGGRPAAPAPKVAPPPALPGAQSNNANAAPASGSPLDMEPTDALFDAINRGDMAAARDAISRGADLRGHNVLGMTPLELSVDLGRNDISFMLLSMRAQDGDDGRPPAAQTASSKSSQLKGEKQATRRSSTTKVASAKRPAPTQTARLFSGDGGTPIPNAGFLGFDPTHR